MLPHLLHCGTVVSIVALQQEDSGIQSHCGLLEWSLCVLPVLEFFPPAVRTHDCWIDLSLYITVNHECGNTRFIVLFCLCAAL